MSWGKLEVGSLLTQVVSVHFHRGNKDGTDVVWVEETYQKRRMSASSMISWSGHWSGGRKLLLTIRPTTAANWSSSPIVHKPHQAEEAWVSVGTRDLPDGRAAETVETQNMEGKQDFGRFASEVRHVRR